MSRIYFDLCCLQRPFDDQSQARIRIESEAVRLILWRCGLGMHKLVSSETLELEASQNPNVLRRRRAFSILTSADERMAIDEDIIAVARGFQSKGIIGFDSLHLAIAEAAGCDVLFTTDDRFLERAKNLRPSVKVRVANPAKWLSEGTEDDS